MSLDKVKDIHILCQVDNIKKRLYITFQTPKTPKTKIQAINRFSAELAKSENNTTLVETDTVSLYLVDTSYG